MWQDVGIVRTGQGMKRAIEKLTQLAPRVSHPHTRRAWEAQNLQSVGLLVARSTLTRAGKPRCSLPHGLSHSQRC